MQTFHCQTKRKGRYVSFCFTGRIVLRFINFIIFLLCFIMFYKLIMINFIVFFYGLICKMCIIFTEPGKLPWWALLTHFQPIFHFYNLWKHRFSDVRRGYRSGTLTENGLRPEVLASFSNIENSLLSHFQQIN